MGIAAMPMYGEGVEQARQRVYIQAIECFQIIKGSKIMANAAAPTEIRLSKDRRTLSVTFDDVTYDLSAELLRVEAPSADVQGHTADQKKLITGKKDVEIMSIDPVGNYAIQIKFDDMHNSGIYSWSTLLDYGQNHDTMLAAYNEAVAAKG